MGSIGHPCRTIEGSAWHLSLMTVQALREVSICDEAKPTTHAVLFNHCPRPGLNVVIQTLLALLPTTSIDKVSNVMGMQFSIGKMIKRRHNSITLCPIDRTDYHFRNGWA